ncbi:MAG: protoporphyrinogen oxidase, partial [Thermoanaerobaculia bacterium]|nr:protoporphyrinogen oxidase [Thermoanaerobaculia bacterium]
AERELAGFLGIRGESVLRRLHRWADAYPQYDLGHLERVARLERACPPGLVLAGHSYRGIGISDAIRSGREAVRRALAEVAPPGSQLTPPRPPC